SYSPCHCRVTTVPEVLCASDLPRRCREDSMAHGIPAEPIGGGANRTSLNITGTGRFGIRLVFVFVNHQFGVAERASPSCRANATRVRPLRLNRSRSCVRCSLTKLMRSPQQMILDIVPACLSP